MTTHAMIDLETLGTTPDCVVLTIGGVKFDQNSLSSPRDELYFRFEVNEQLNKGRTTMESTLEWWGKQEESVREEALGDGNRTPVLEVLQALNKWCVGADTIWCQGPVFDTREALGQEAPAMLPFDTVHPQEPANGGLVHTHSLPRAGICQVNGVVARMCFGGGMCRVALSLSLSPKSAWCPIYGVGLQTSVYMVMCVCTVA